MSYQDFTVTIAPLQQEGYPITALADGLGRVSAILPQPTAELQAQLSQIATLTSAALPLDAEDAVRRAGEALFVWLTGRDGIEAHLRVAWDRAQRSQASLRVRLSIDAPELSAWPWELLHDPARDHPFATSPDTLLVRYFDQTQRFGGLADIEADLPLDLLLVLPHAPDLELAHERANLEHVVHSMPGVLRMRVLEGIVTRSDMADALLLGKYDIVHFGGHGAFLDGRGYLSLNTPDGGQDWVHSGVLSRLAGNFPSIKLVVLNACSTAQVDDVIAFQGLAPQMVRYGVPAVVAMQYAVSDAAAATFSREFYKRLCLGSEAGQVDVAISYARSMLAVLHAGERHWAAPVLFTHAPDGVIYRLLAGQPQPVAAFDPATQLERLAALAASLQASQRSDDDWSLAEPDQLLLWREALQRVMTSYQAHATHPRSDVQEVARKGLALTQARVAALERALAGSPARPQ